METLHEREARIARLEADRASRNANTVWPTPDDAGTGVFPVEVAPGRGDLNISSSHIPNFPTSLSLIGHRTVSFARLFQSQPWVAAAVMWMLTRSIRVPLKCYRRVGDDSADRVRLRPQEHPLADAIAAPWDRASQAQFIMSLLGPVLVHGNSVTKIESGANDRISFMPKDWRFTRPIMPWRDSLVGWVFDIDQPMFSNSNSVDEVLHLAWWSPTGPIGTSPLQQLGVTLQIEDAAQRFQRAVFNNGARPPSAITVDDKFLGLDAKERKQILAQLRRDVEDIYSGPENAGRPALLPPGLDWKPVGHTLVEAELISQRHVNREETCAVYLIPPPLLGILDKATYSNIAVQRDMTYTDCLGPPLIMLEQAINSQIVRNLLREDDVFVEFDFGVVLRGNRLDEIVALRDAIGSALLTPNEGRGVLNMPKSEDEAMDSFYLPFNNLQPVGQGPVPGIVPPQIESPPPNEHGQAGARRSVGRSAGGVHVAYTDDRDLEEALV